MSPLASGNLALDGLADEGNKLFAIFQNGTDFVLTALRKPKRYSFEKRLRACHAGYLSLTTSQEWQISRMDATEIAMTPHKRKFKTLMLAKLREYLTDGKARPARLVDCYRATITKLEAELAR